MAALSRREKQQQNENATLLGKRFAPMAQRFPCLINRESRIGFQLANSWIIVGRVPLLLQSDSESGKRLQVRTEPIRDTTHVFLWKGWVKRSVAHLPQPPVIDTAVHQIVLFPRMGKAHDLVRSIGQYFVEYGVICC